MGGALKKSVVGGEKRALKPHEEMLCGITAGVVSATVGSPLELIMIQQQRKGGGTIETIKNIANPSTIGRGFIGAAIREGLWTCGYLSIPPIVRSNLREMYPDTFDSDSKARIPAALLGGLFACYLTHPADTIKTCMQGDIEQVRFKGYGQSAGVLVAESGIAALWRGMPWRLFRQCCAVFLFDKISAEVAPRLFPHAFR